MQFYQSTLTIQHESALDSLADTLRYQPEIRHVIYSTDARGKVLPMSGALMKSLCNGFLAGYNSIQLTISKVQITEQEIKNMVDLFSERSKLRTLTLSDCNMSDSTFALLGLMILQYKPKHLRYLDFSRNQIGFENIPPGAFQADSTLGCKVLSRILIDESIHISCLDLSDNPLNNFGVLAIAQVLPHSELRELRLARVRMTHNGFLCLNRVLRVSPSLSLLDVSHNVLGFRVMSLLIPTLQSIQLISLNLSDTQLDDLSLISLGSALKHKTTLTELDISENVVSAQAAELFIECLKSNTTLTKLTCRDMGVPALSVFVAAGSSADSLSCQVDCLISESLSTLSPLKYFSIKGYILSGLVYIIGILVLDLFDMVMDTMAIIEYFQGGNVIWATLNIIFIMLGNLACGFYYFVWGRKKRVKRTWNAILYCLFVGQYVDAFLLIKRTKGNWDKLLGPITNEDLVHMSTFDNTAIIRSVFESLPQVILQGYILLVEQEETSVFVILSFLGSIASLAWVIATWLSGINPADIHENEERIEASIFWNLRLFVYSFVSLALNLFRISLIASYEFYFLAVYVAISAFYWFTFFLIIVAPSRYDYLGVIRNAFFLFPFAMAFYSDTLFISAKGQTRFFRQTRAVPRFIFFIVDTISWAFRSFSMLVYLMILQNNLHFLVLATMLLAVLLDITLIFLRIILEKNGSTTALKRKQVITTQHQHQIEGTQQRRLQDFERMLDELQFHEIIDSDSSSDSDPLGDYTSSDDDDSDGHEFDSANFTVSHLTTKSATTTPRKS